MNTIMELNMTDCSKRKTAECISHASECSVCYAQIRLKDIVEEEINQIISNGRIASWYDGISWIPLNEFPPPVRDEAYQQIFAAIEKSITVLYDNEEVVVHHNGNGYYFAGAREKL